MKTYSQNGLALTRQFEGLHLTAYADPVGIWTIGYGHTGPGVHPGLTVSREQADALLSADVIRTASAVNKLVTVPINQNQFDALVDFAFNLGPGALASSTLLHCINTGDFSAAAREFPRWDRATGRITPGLLRRRLAEVALFTQPVANLQPATNNLQLTSPAQP
jgi:lysozyme